MTGVLNCKALIDSDVTQDEHNSVESLWKEYNDIKKQAKTLEGLVQKK